MKYGENNKPLVCMMTQSTCYRNTRTFVPKGILWHSTGANNPYLMRYVQPDDDAPDRDQLLDIIGVNEYGNDWNHIDVDAGLNFWIGKLKDGTVASVQTMPFIYRPWGCGSGSKGSCNDTHIQFEICEDGLDDPEYFNAVYQEACEMTAYLCKVYDIDPRGVTICDGVTVPTILDHVSSYRYGLGSQHGDVEHWFSRYGKTLGNVRADVRKLLETPEPQPSEGPTPPNEPTKPRTEYNITYRTYSHRFGWLNWVGDGETSGTQGQSTAIEAIQIEGGYAKDILASYKLYLETTGETALAKCGEVSGTEDLGRDAQAILIECNVPIKYRAYCQKKGWTRWPSNGKWAGAKGEGLRLEAVQIKVDKKK